MPNIKLISIGLIVLFWLAFARTPVVLVTALTSTLSPALVNARVNGGEVKTTKISCRAPVHQTGQTDCYDKDTHEKVPCPGSHEGQDGNQKKGAKWNPESRFTDNGDGTVTDNLTGLMWLQNANCADPDPNNTPKEPLGSVKHKMNGAMTWKQALEQVENLNKNGEMTAQNCGDQNNYNDWRVPNIKELQSLISYGKLVNGEGGQVALPEGHPFTGVQSYRYWSSTTRSDKPERAWGVYLLYGGVRRGFKASYFYVWPVRGGQ